MTTKLTLDLEQLAVDSFDTAVSPTRAGTVFGEECTCRTNCTCPGCPTCVQTDCSPDTCEETCYGSCDVSCIGSCNSCYDTCDYTCDGGWECG
jgi:hypothetical protein